MDDADHQIDIFDDGGRDDQDDEDPPPLFRFPWVFLPSTEQDQEDFDEYRDGKSCWGSDDFRAYAIDKLGQRDFASLSRSTINEIMQLVAPISSAFHVARCRKILNIALNETSTVEVCDVQFREPRRKNYI